MYEGFVEVDMVRGKKAFLHQIVRTVLGAALFLLPFMVFAFAQTSPSSAAYEPLIGENAGNPQSLPFAQIVTQTQTAAAATQTAVAIETENAGTLTAVPGTQTAIAATQTAIPARLTALAATQTAQAGPTSTQLFIDIYEPNNSFQEAPTITTGVIQNLTLWPLGDRDFFRFYAKGNTYYEIFTKNLTGDLDTVLTVYNTNGSVVDVNDDYTNTSRASKVFILADQDGYYYIMVENKAPTDPATKTYQLEIKERTPPTATPTITRLPSSDACDTANERNDTFQTACLLIANDSIRSYDFVPASEGEYDQDFFRMWVQQGFEYSCETSQLSSLNDTKFHVLDANGNLIATADNQEAGDLSSKWEQRVWFTGWIYFQVLPVFAPEFDLSPRYTYKFGCSAVFPTATPTFTPWPTNTPWPTSTPSSTFTPWPTLTPSRTGVPPTATSPPTATRRPSTGGGGGVPPTARPSATFTPGATPTVVVVFPTPPTPTPRPAVVIVPLPTATPMGQQMQEISVNVTIYYDANLNYTPELTEGIRDVSVALYDNASGQLLGFGSTNDAGMIHLGPIPVRGAARLEVPFLAFSQIIIHNEPDIRVRVALATLPGNIP